MATLFSPMSEFKPKRSQIDNRASIVFCTCECGLYFDSKEAYWERDLPFYDKEHLERWDNHLMMYQFIDEVPSEQEMDELLNEIAGPSYPQPLDKDGDKK